MGLIIHVFGLICRYNSLNVFLDIFALSLKQIFSEFEEA